MAMTDDEVGDLEARRLLDWAVRYASRHWKVLPLWEIRDGVCSCPAGARCGSPGKHPYGDLVPHGVKDASSDLAVVKGWWKKRPRANVGIACGDSGLVVVDLDPRNGGDESMLLLQRRHGPLTATVRSLTGGGGEHWLYGRPKGYARVPCDVLADGVDIKADGGYVVAPPSSHISGGRYEWDADCHPNDVHVAPLPDWIRRQLDCEVVEGAGTSGTTPGAGAGGCGDVETGFVGAAFAAAGWLKGAVGPGKAAAQCPWKHEHSEGAGARSSTVVFGPTPDKAWGWFHCSHAHCAGRTWQEVLAAIPEEAKADARERLGVDERHGSGGAAAAPPPTDDDAPPEQRTEYEGWRSRLTYTDKGMIRTRSAGNLSLLLANHDEWAGTLGWNRFSDTIRWIRQPPAIEGMGCPGLGDEITDDDYILVQQWWELHEGLYWARDVIKDAMVRAARMSQYHPLQEYLSALRWDGRDRLDRWLSTYMRADDNEYVRKVGRWWLVSAVARALDPGCQADHVLVLESRTQGYRKSSAMRVLAGDWYLGSLPRLDRADAPLVLQGAWICELGELDAFRGVQATRVKDFISQPTDRYRAPYARYAITRQRSCVFVGTTNEDTYLYDSTGARRFWPVRVRAVADTVALERDRDQLFAEAKEAYLGGATWWPDTDDVPVLEAEQDERQQDDPWRSTVLQWAERQMDPFRIADILFGPLDIPKERWDVKKESRLRAILRKGGYINSPYWSAVDGKTMRRWRREE